ncbi:MAG: hypothetical protein A4E57_02047 [Syntrophorhabdaceae bacterium PtaU1.Bin034]|nr:MAG: hypothetical protein A4E57_02047 [Syntrophorhabdaceae bacterium PtaU1.Bin034]
MHDDLSRFQKFEREHVRIRRPNPAFELGRLILRSRLLLISVILLLSAFMLTANWLIGIASPYFGMLFPFSGEAVELLPGIPQGIPGRPGE